jgi:hypothetical protein
MRRCFGTNFGEKKPILKGTPMKANLDKLNKMASRHAFPPMQQMTN